MKDTLDFLNEKNYNELNYLGYTKLGVLPVNILNQLKEETDILLRKAKQKFPKGELFNLINSDFETKTASIELVDKHLVPFLKEKLDTTKVDILPVSHLVKPFGLKSGIWHQDSSVVDERTDISLNAWLPFVKSHRMNGCMWMFPGSHINENHFRQFGYNFIDGKLLKKMHKYMVPLTVEAGEIVLFHRNIIHGSSRNWLPKDRIAIEALITTKDAQLYNFHRERAILENKILGFKVDIEHYKGPNPKEDFYNEKYPYEVFEDEGFEVTQQYLLNSIPLFIEHSKKLQKDFR